MNTDRKLITAAEERRLLIRAEAGDAGAVERLVEANIGLIRVVVRRFVGYGEVDDLVQSGIVGLLQAIARFDRKRNVRLTTYALPYILGEVRRQAAQLGRIEGGEVPDDGVDDTADIADRLTVRDAIRELSPVERQLVLWRYYEERSQAETARLLGVSQPQVSRLEQKACQKMGKTLIPGGDVGDE